MTQPLRALRRAAAAFALLACAISAPSTAAAASGPRPVTTLLVQLRDAPAHGALVRERAQHAGTEAALATREAQRWQRVLDAAGPDLKLASRRAFGARAHSLRLAAPLPREQAERLALRLAALPDVAWAAPGGRERRLQTGNPPDDPFFAQGFTGQWWLLSPTGSDGVPIEQRLRGVAGFLTAWMQVGTGSVDGAVAVLDSGITDHPELAGRSLPGYDMVSDLGFSNDGDGRDPDPNDPGDWVDDADLARPAYRDAGCVREDSSWHGTAIAGMLAARTNDRLGIAAMNWAAPVLPVRVAAKCGADVEDIIDGMRWAAGLEVCRRSDSRGGCIESAPLNPNPVRILTLSFGGNGDCAAYQPTIDELRALPGGGVVIVAAAGNEHSTPTRPAKCPGVVGVVATNRDGFKSNYSNFGPELSASGIATVGGDDGGSNCSDERCGRWRLQLADSGILSIGNSGRTSVGAPAHYYYFGTSFSAPIVAGALGLMLSVNPQLGADQLIHGLRRSARPHVGSSLPGVAACSADNPGRCLCTAATCGAGLLDVTQALLYARDPAAYVAPVWPPQLIDGPELAQAAALGPDRDPVAPPSVTASGGGGASSLAWLLGLLAATLALRPRR